MELFPKSKGERAKLRNLTIFSLYLKSNCNLIMIILYHNKYLQDRERSSILCVAKENISDQTLSASLLKGENLSYISSITL